MALHVLTYNLTRVINIMGPRPLIAAIMTALNLLPSIATPASAKRPIVRQSTTNRLQTI
jgi:hypothetical protein